MKIHHLNCGSIGHLVCHCLLIETPSSGLILIDTGLSSTERYPFLTGFLRPTLAPDQSAVAQVRRLGFSDRDVRHIVLTHLDFDHAGGIEDFPEATIHVLADEKKAALSRKSWLERTRYRPELFESHQKWQTYSPRGEPWYGFEAVWQLNGLPPEILMIPLIGHTLGHAGVVVETSSDWLLHAGDAYFYRNEMDPQKPRCTLGLIALQRMMDTRRAWRVRNQKRLRELLIQHGDCVRIFSAHDRKEFEALQNGTTWFPQKRAA